MYVSSLISLAPLTPGNDTEQGAAGMNTRYSQPMFLQIVPEMGPVSSCRSAEHKVASKYTTINNVLDPGAVA